VWLIGLYIPPYGPASRENHEPERPRKLLMHRGEIERLIGRTQERGLTLVPTRIYFAGSRSRAKVEIALAKGKDLYDKRDSIRKRGVARDVQRELRDAQR
jgi:SsrA-binding protein